MNITDRLTPDPGHFHAVQFYDDASSLARLVGAFLTDGFLRGDAGVAIATPEHWALIAADLRERAVDVEALKRMGQLVVLDAQATLDAFMVNGLPHAGTFQYVAGQVMDQVCRTQPDRTIRAYGEMVNVLWKDGMEAASIRLEMLWNELAATRDFKLLCGYSMGNFYKGAAVDDIKAQHSHLVEPTADPAFII